MASIMTTICRFGSLRGSYVRYTLRPVDSWLRERPVFAMNWTKCFSNGLNGLNSSDDTQEPKDETDVNKLKEENNKLMQLLSEVDDKYKRSLADGENTRIRMKKQIDETKIYAIQAFSKDLLEVADVLNTAIDTVPLNTITDDNTEQSKVLKNLYSGLQMTEKQLQSVFRRHGLIQMNPIGEKFDPNSHHALFEAVLPDKEPGTVSTVTKIGYKLHDRTIRPAMVGVVKA